jgi:phosphoribosylanthranilate isomerase
MVIKVCGMREAENIRAVEELGVQWLGLIFWSKSSRYVAMPPAYLPTRAKRIGVFVDAPIDEVMQHVTDYGLHAVQLHGKESPEYVRECKNAQCAIIKAFNIATPADLKQTEPYEGLVYYFLFDTKGPSVGGNGTQFDWTVLNAYHGTTPFLLSGGIGPDDVPRIRSFSHPQQAGIDLNSRFELAPGLKDVNAITRFLKELQAP